MAHTHVPQRAGARHFGRLAVAFAITFVVMVLEAVAGFVSRSLALLSDAGHVATDAVGLGMALAAIAAGNREQQPEHRTFGVYRLEILAALANAVLLFGVALYVLYEAIRRLLEPTEVISSTMIVVAVIGLLANLFVLWLLHRGSRESVNVEGAYLEVLADALGSVGVLLAAVVIAVTGWHQADAVFGAAIGFFIIPRAYRLARKAIRILIQAAPEHIDVEELRTRLAAIPGVLDVHDLHVWTLTSDMEVASVHLVVADERDTHRVLDEAAALLKDEFGITHATLQVEPSTHEVCAELRW